VKRAPLRPAGETIAAIQARIAEIRAENDAQRRGEDADLSDARRALLAREAAVARARSLSIVGERFMHRTFETFERCPENADALASARFSIADEPLMGVAFYGPVGVGKTHLAAAMAHEVIERGIPVVIDSVNALLRRIRLTFDAGVKLSEDEVVQRVAGVPLLVLDDLGKEYLTPWAATTLWDIANARYERNLPLVVTSNSDLAGLFARYSQPIAGLDEQTLPAMFDRVVEMVGGVDRFRAIGGDSRRAIVEAVR